MKDRVPIIFAHELPLCECCDEPWCPKHQQHYADCTCLGPSNAEDEGYEMIKIRGKWWGIKKD
jgi:hypothetical protein